MCLVLARKMKSINWLDANRYNIISVSGILLFFTATFIYFQTTTATDANDAVSS
jgi:hypothetical protein